MEQEDEKILDAQFQDSCCREPSFAARAESLQFVSLQPCRIPAFRENSEREATASHSAGCGGTDSRGHHISRSGETSRGKQRCDKHMRLCPAPAAHIYALITTEVVARLPRLVPTMGRTPRLLRGSFTRLTSASN